MTSHGINGVSSRGRGTDYIWYNTETHVVLPIPKNGNVIAFATLMKFKFNLEQIYYLESIRLFRRGQNTAWFADNKGIIRSGKSWGDNTMAKWNRTKSQRVIYKSLHSLSSMVLNIISVSTTKHFEKLFLYEQWES